MAKVAKIARLAPPRPSNSSIRERVTSRLAKQILSGDYKQGALLPTEAQLGAEFKVSRTALREAVRTLAAKGLVESRQRAGTRVLASEDWNRLDTDVLRWMGEIEPDLDFVKGLTEAHGGHVLLESEVGKGTRVSIHLPQTRMRRRPPKPDDVPAHAVA